jgi:sec-independent protein translocase protein TatC
MKAKVLMAWLTDDSEQGSTKSFLGHLEDLRRTLIWSGAALLTAVCISVPLAPHVLHLIKIPLRQAGKDPDQYLRMIEVAGGISIATQLVLWTGVLLSAPFIVFFALRFVFPGLTPRERKAVLNSMWFAVLLFVLGVASGYWLVLRVTLQWLFAINDWLGVTVDFIRVTDYVALVVKLLLAFGLAFEFPVVLLTLGRLGVVTGASLASKRRHVIVLLLIVAAVITPTVDPVTQTLVALPLYVLYEMCIWILFVSERRSRAAK